MQMLKKTARKNSSVRALLPYGTFWYRSLKGGNARKTLIKLSIKSFVKIFIDNVQRVWVSDLEASRVQGFFVKLVYGGYWYLFSEQIWLKASVAYRKREQTSSLSQVPIKRVIRDLKDE